MHTGNNYLVHLRCPAVTEAQRDKLLIKLRHLSPNPATTTTDPAPPPLSLSLSLCLFFTPSLSLHSSLLPFPSSTSFFLFFLSSFLP